MMSVKQSVKWIGRGNRSTSRKPTPAPLCPPQNPTWQTRSRTPDRSCVKPATNRLSYGAAFLITFRRLLRLAGSRWRYSTPPPHMLQRSGFGFRGRLSSLIFHLVFLHLYMPKYCLKISEDYFNPVFSYPAFTFNTTFDSMTPTL
jgi:hypothetical protein